MNLIKNKIFLYSLILGFLGFLDATYLTILHYKNILPPCHLTSNCETVLTSQYAQIGPIPVALLGTLFYLAVMAVCILLLTNYKKIFLNSYYLLIGSGFVVSLVLIYIQAYLLHAYCQYCILAEIVSGGLVILAIIKYRSDKKA